MRIIGTTIAGLLAFSIVSTAFADTTSTNQSASKETLACGCKNKQGNQNSQQNSDQKKGTKQSS